MRLNKAKIASILESRITEISPKEIPHFSLLKDIQKATLRIVEAIEKKEKIVIVGDYDVDGVVSSTIMKRFFDVISSPVTITIPDRFKDGYGLTPSLLEKIDADVIITVDNGITANESARICKERHIDLIITDHHTPKETLPDAYAIVNPKQPDDTFPFKEICGAEVAWYLCASLKAELHLTIDMKEYLDYLGLAIIADVMPLTHMNRVLVKMALSRLSRSKKPFAVAIREFLRKEAFTSEDIGFGIAPRINAAGRMHHASLAFDFLMSDSLSEAKRLLQNLDETNLDRKRQELEFTQIASDQAQSQQHFIVVSGEFHEGIVGIIASRMVDKYKLPCIVFTDQGENLKGSGRSLGDVNIFKIIKSCEHLLEGFGGHKLACGLSIKKENLDAFTAHVKNEASRLSKELFFQEDFTLGELPFEEIDFELLDILKRYEPFGEANPKPKFTSKAVIEHVQNLKENHYKVVFRQNDTYHQGILFRYDGEFHERCEITYTINENRFNNQSNIQLTVESLSKV